MYCKNCGKKLPDNARFCDRCNMSVRKKNGKLDLIGELKEERLARRKAKEVEERLKKIKKVKRRKRQIVLGVIITILIIGLIATGVGFFIGQGFTTKNGPIEEIPKTTETVTKVPVTASPTGEMVNQENLNSDGYIVSSASGISFAYPGTFTKSSGSGLLNFKDVRGDGVITVNSEVTNSEAKDIMKQYGDSKGGKISNSRAQESSYSISGVNGSTAYHRAGVVKNGKDVYYELTYGSASQKKDEYEKNIAYMDAFIMNK